MTTPFDPDVSFGKLTINSVSMHTYAWLVLDPRPLILPRSYRSGNIVIPGAQGTRSKPYRIDEVTHSLPMFLTGMRTSTGGANANAFTGMMNNIAALRAAVTIPPTAPTATLAATLTLVPGSTKTYSAGVQVALEVGPAHEGDMPQRIDRALLHITVPSGYFST